VPGKNGGVKKKKYGNTPQWNQPFFREIEQRTTIEINTTG